MKTSVISGCLFAAMNLWGMVSPAHALTWCHDFAVHRVSNGKENPNKLGIKDLRKRLIQEKYLPFRYPATTDAATAPAVKPGDVIILDDDHSGVVNSRGRIDHFIQVEGKTGVAYQPDNLPRPVADKRGGFFENDTLPEMHSRMFVKKPRTAVVWRKTAEFQKGKRLGGATLAAKKSDATDVGVVLEAGKPYIIVGEGTCSLWPGRNDGCDSVYRYFSPTETNGGPLKVWGQLKLIDPTIHLCEAIANQTGKEPEYNKGHVYEAVVLGEGKSLKATVYDGGGYSDNGGQLKVTVYEAVPRMR